MLISKLTDLQKKVFEIYKPSKKIKSINYYNFSASCAKAQICLSSRQ